MICNAIVRGGVNSLYKFCRNGAGIEPITLLVPTEINIKETQAYRTIILQIRGAYHVQ